MVAFVNSQEWVWQESGLHVARVVSVLCSFKVGFGGGWLGSIHHIYIYKESIV